MSDESPASDALPGAVRYLMQRRRAHSLLEKPVHRLEQVLGKPQDVTVASAIAESLAELLLVVNPAMQEAVAPVVVKSAPVVAPPPIVEEPPTIANSITISSEPSALYELIVKRARALNHSAEDVAACIAKHTQSKKSDALERVRDGFIMSAEERRAIAHCLQVDEHALWNEGRILPL